MTLAAAPYSGQSNRIDPRMLMRCDRDLGGTKCNTHAHNDLDGLLREAGAQGSLVIVCWRSHQYFIKKRNNYYSTGNFRSSEDSCSEIQSAASLIGNMGHTRFTKMGLQRKSVSVRLRLCLFLLKINNAIVRLEQFTKMHCFFSLFK